MLCVSGLSRTTAWIAYSPGSSGQSGPGKPIGRGVDPHGLPRLPVLDVAGEERLGTEPVGPEPGLDPRVARARASRRPGPRSAGSPASTGMRPRRPGPPRRSTPFWRSASLVLGRAAVVATWAERRARQRHSASRRARQQERPNTPVETSDGGARWTWTSDSGSVRLSMEDLSISEGLGQRDD